MTGPVQMFAYCGTMVRTKEAPSLDVGIETVNKLVTDGRCEMAAITNPTTREIVYCVAHGRSWSIEQGQKHLVTA